MVLSSEWIQLSSGDRRAAGDAHREERIEERARFPVPEPDAGIPVRDERFADSFNAAASEHAEFAGIAVFRISALFRHRGFASKRERIRVVDERGGGCRFTRELYEALRDRDFIARRAVRQAYDEQAQMFLPDRYVRGTCPRCRSADQYGDSCEVCGSTYSPADLIDPVSTVTGTRPVWRQSDHLFFKLGAFESMLREYVAGRSLQDAVRAKLGEWFEAGLQDWDISRDAPYFGIEVPDAPGKFFYVWFDAPIGYIASFEAWRAAHGASFDEYWKSETALGALSLHRQGHQLLSHAVLARGAAWRRTAPADGRVRPRLPDHQRPEDVEVARHFHHGAALPGTPAARAAALLLCGQARQRHRRYRLQYR